MSVRKFGPADFDPGQPIYFAGLDRPSRAAEVIFDFGPRAVPAVREAIEKGLFTRKQVADAMEELLWEEV